MKFSKVRVNDKEVGLEWTTDDLTTKGHVDHSLTSADRPHEDFIAALQAFRPFIGRLLEVRDKWLETVTVTGLSISENAKSGRRGIVITALKPIADANAPFVIHTPHLNEPGESDGEEQGANGTGATSGVWLKGMDEALEAVVVQADRYIKGFREQGDLFEQPPKPELAGAEA